MLENVGRITRKSILVAVRPTISAIIVYWYNTKYIVAYSFSVEPRSVSQKYFGKKRATCLYRSACPEWAYLGKWTPKSLGKALVLTLTLALQDV